MAGSSNSSKKSGEHLFFLGYAAFHEKKESTEGGACLLKHVTSFNENNSCSYRWQGVKKSKEAPVNKIYDSVKDSSIRTMGDDWIADQSDGVVIKTLKKAKSNKSVVELERFATGFAPYGNQVHHVLPCGAFKKAAFKVSESTTGLLLVIIGGLLEEKYNINHKDNMIVLPTNEKVSCRVGLPRHYGSHPTYSNKIQGMVTEALDPYKKVADQIAKGEPHDEVDPVTLKEALEDISEQMFDNILKERPEILGKCKQDFVKVNTLPEHVYAVSL